MNEAIPTSTSTAAARREPIAARPERLAIALSALALAGALAWLYAPSVVWLLAQWDINPYYAHGPLLPFVTAWLLWRERDEIKADWRAHLSRSNGAQVDGAPFDRRQSRLDSLAKWTAPLCLAFGLLCYLVGALADVNMAQALSIPFVLLGVARLAGGPQVARRVRFALLFLLLAVPSTGLIIEWLSVPMQLNSARVAALSLGLLGVPLHRDGVNILAPGYNFVVEEGCSGLKTAVTLLTMGVLTAHLLPGLRQAQRFGLALCSIPVALVANTLRVMAIVLIGTNFGTKAAEGFLHNFSGVLMFALAMALLLGAARWMSVANDNWNEVDDAPEHRPTIPSTAPGSILRSWPMKTIVVATAMMLLTRGLSVWGVQAPPPSQVARVLSLPSRAGAWQGKSMVVEPSLYNSLRAEAIVRKRYYLPDGTSKGMAENRAVDVIVIYSRDFKSLHSPLSCLLAGGWTVQQEETRVLKRGAQTVSLNMLRGAMNGQQTLQTYFFADTSREVSGMLATAARMAGNRMLRRNDGAVKVQLAYAPALWQRDGKISPQLESLVFGLDDTVRQSLARGHKASEKAAS